MQPEFVEVGLKRKLQLGITVHCFRPTFRDWVVKCTDYPDSLAERALTHIIAAQTIAAYGVAISLKADVCLKRQWCSSFRKRLRHKSTLLLFLEAVLRAG